MAPPKLNENPDEPAAAGVPLGVVLPAGVVEGVPKLKPDFEAPFGVFEAAAGVVDVPKALGVLVLAPNGEGPELPPPNAEEVLLLPPNGAVVLPLPPPNADGVADLPNPDVPPLVPKPELLVFPNAELPFPKADVELPVFPNADVVPKALFAGSFAPPPNGEVAGVDGLSEGPKLNLGAVVAPAAPLVDVPLVVGAPEAAVVGVLKLKVGPDVAIVGGFASAPLPPAPRAPVNDEVLPGVVEVAADLLKLKLNF